VVEHVEELGTELGSDALADRRVLKKAEIEIPNGRAAADGSRRIPNGAELLVDETGGIEGIVAL